MFTIKTDVSPLDVATEKPWYDLIGEPEPPEDGMQQYRTIRDISSVLGQIFDDREDVLVTGGSFIVYNDASPGSIVAPDCYIAFGVDARLLERTKRSYRISEWGKPPDVVIEVASESTAKNDLDGKRRLYEQIGIPEYWRFDGLGGEFYGSPIIGERLLDGKYQPCSVHTSEDGNVWHHSELLGLDFCWQEAADGYGRLRVQDADTGEWLNFLDEEREARLSAEKAREVAEDAREAAEDARLAAEARAAELEAELRRLRGE